MLKDARQTAILRQLRLRGSVATDELANELGVSPISVRRDLRDLELQGQLRRVHGGATVPRQSGRADAALEAAALGLSPASARPNAPLAVIGMIVPGSEYYFADVIKGASEAARIAGIRLILGVTHYDTRKEQEMVAHMAHVGVDALIWAPAKHDLTLPGVREVLASPAAPIILMERRPGPEPDAPEIDSVRTDHARGAELGIRHMHSLGKRRIAMLAIPNATTPRLQDGYAKAVDELGLPVLNVDLGLTEQEISDWAATPDLFASRFLDAADELDVDGLLINPDMHAVAVARELVSRGRVVPDDIAIVAYDDVIAHLCEVPISAVAPPRFDVGANAVTLALRRIRAHAEQRTLATIHTTLVPQVTVRDAGGLHTTTFG